MVHLALVYEYMKVERQQLWTLMPKLLLYHSTKLTTGQIRTSETTDQNTFCRMHYYNKKET